MSDGNRKMAKLSNLNRSRAMGMVEAGRSYQQIANHLHVAKRTVVRLVQRYRATDSVKDRPRSGRPKCTTVVEDRRIRLLSLQQRTRPATVIRDVIRADRQHDQQGLCSQTVRNRLHEFGLKSRKAAQKPTLAQHHRDARMQWATRCRRWNRAQWSHVLFTDESRFCLEHVDSVFGVEEENDLPIVVSSKSVRVEAAV